MSDIDPSDSLPFDEPPATRLFGAFENGEIPIQKPQTEQPQTIRVGSARSSEVGPSAPRRTAPRSLGVSDWEAPGVEELARLLPQYEIEKLLGRGGMAAVYKGLQIELDRPVAIKLLPAEMAADQEFLDRFRREARVLAKLQHPGIVAIYDFGQTREGHLYFVMEYVDGTDLNYIVRGPGLNPGQALELICQICDALNYAHRQNVIHRDIKPSNILVSRDGFAKLADFGLARPVHDDFGGLTGTHMVMGTLEYMAPEQREGAVDHRADIFALGVTLYEMLTGKPPRGAFEPASRKSRVDARIDEVVHRALQVEPDQRYQQVSELRTDVDRIRSGPPAPIIPEPPNVVLPSRSLRMGKFAVASAALVLLGIGAFLYAREKGLLPARFADMFNRGDHAGETSSASDQNEDHPIASKSGNRKEKNTPPPVASVTAQPNPGSAIIAPAHWTPAPWTPAPAPTPDPASIERARVAAELERQRREEEANRQQQAQRKMIQDRQKLAEMEAKTNADAEVLQKAEELDGVSISSSAANGDVAAQSVLALWQLEGYKVRKDPSAAMHWAILAADHENPVGQAALALINWEDPGQKANREKAATQALKALPGLTALAAKHEASASYALGRFYSLGIGVQRQPGTAVDFYKPAAQQGFSLAQNALGLAYEIGDGVPKDPVQAKSLFDQAATAYLLKRESVSQGDVIVGLDAGTPVVIVAQRNGMVTVKTRNLQLDVPENDLSRDAKAAKSALEQASARQRAVKEKVAADLLAQQQQQEFLAGKAREREAARLAAQHPLSPEEKMAALKQQEMQIGAQISDASAQLSQIRVVGNVRTSPNAAQAVSARQGLQSQIQELNAQLRELRKEEMALRAGMNPGGNRGGTSPGTALRGATLQPSKGL